MPHEQLFTAAGSPADISLLVLSSGSAGVRRVLPRPDGDGVLLQPDPLRGERDEQLEVGLEIPFHEWAFDFDHLQTRATDFLDHDERYRRSEQFIRALSGIWTEDNFNLRGDFYRFTRRLFGKEPFPGVNPDESVAAGAAIVIDHRPAATA